MIEVKLTKVIAETERFDSVADARRAAQLVGVELLGSRPRVQPLTMGWEQFYIVYVGVGEYLKAPRA